MKSQLLMGVFLPLVLGYMPTNLSAQETGVYFTKEKVSDLSKVQVYKSFLPGETIYGLVVIDPGTNLVHYSKLVEDERRIPVHISGINAGNISGNSESQSGTISWEFALPKDIIQKKKSKLGNFR